MAYINGLPQPFLANSCGSWWPVFDIEVQTGLVRIDVCGLLEVKDISDFQSFRDAAGIEHPADGFYVDAVPDEREPICRATGATP